MGTDDKMQPLILKVTQSSRTGVQAHSFSRTTIGYVIRGVKYFYMGDLRFQVAKGEVFFMGPGVHYIEDSPEGGKPFEQIAFHFHSELVTRILSDLSLSFGLNIANDHTCDKCRNQSHIAYPAWSVLQGFFSSVGQYVKEGVFEQGSVAAMIKTAELLYLIVSHPDCCLKAPILGNVDPSRESFEQIVRRNIFTGASIEALAAECSRSASSFKKDFRRHFSESPHKWFIRQRLMHSRLLLISTSKSVLEVANECKFKNASQYIKHFKQEYGVTPAVYRVRHDDEKRARSGGERKVPADELSAGRRSKVLGAVPPGGETE